MTSEITATDLSIDRLTQDWRAATLLGLAVAGAAFLGALISQYGFGLKPCPLCIWQRYPYVLGALPAIGALIAPAGLRGPLLGLAAAVFVVGAGVGVFHSGVEFGWWEGLASCSAGGPSPTGVSAEELTRQLLETLPAGCATRVPFIFLLSMANWNVLVSAGVAALFALGSRAAWRAAR